MLLRTKVEVLILVSMLVILSVGSALSVNRYISPSGDDIETFIRNSNGKYYTANEEGLHDAIDNLANLTGWVDGNMQYINISRSVKVGTNCELRNLNLYLDDNADCAMILNYDPTNGNDNISIHNVILEGNCYGQPLQNSSMPLENEPCGIYLIKCDNTNIHDVTINGTMYNAMVVKQSSYNRFQNIYISNIGRCLEDWVGRGDCYSANGLFFYNSSYGTASNIIMNDIFSCGIGVEGFLPTPYEWRSHHVTLSDVIIKDCNYGVYFEDGRDTVVSNVMVDGCSLKNTGGYTSSAGFVATQGTSCDISIIGCTVNNSAHYGFQLNAERYNVDTCTVSNVSNDGFRLNLFNSSIANSRIENIGAYGIKYLSGDTGECSNNYIYNCAQWGAGIGLGTSENITCMFNTIKGIGGQYPNIGIYQGNWSFVMFNNIMDVQFETNAMGTGTRVNCTGFDDWNFYDGVS